MATRVNKKSENDKIIGIRVDGDLVSALRKLAKQKDRSISSCVRVALRRYIKNETEEARYD